ncbi:hypothetical protein IGI04_040576 [Brassica rapa subsp. trilocularis]|uniref:Uncharacterized protein n=1 Tax=Brassica rapa subsp. trilocularis TaxID=1813537 RepID=A0ABQ7KR74_BRACM|nr:hypothetical protein IGI04_040576 [Brassica rapa subsp. trilocularis]
MACGPGSGFRVNHNYNFSYGPYSASLGVTTTGTRLDFAFYRSEAGHYRVPVLHAASAEATIRLINVLLVWMKIQVPNFTTLHVWSRSRVVPNLVPLLGDPRLSLLIMACGRVPSVGLVPTDSLAFPRMMSLGVVLNVERVSPFIVWGIVRRGSNTPSGFSTSFLPGLIGFSSDLWVLSLLVGLRKLSEEDWYPEWSFTGKMRYLILLLGTPYLAGGFGVPRYLTICGDDTCGPSPSPSWGMMLLWAEPAGAYEFSMDPRP